MRDVPERSFENRGFGVIQVAHREWDDRITATMLVRNLLNAKSLPEDSEPMQKALSMVKGMFSRINVGDQYDWYTTSRFLGHPSAELSKTLSTQLAIVKGALREQSAVHFATAVAIFKESYGVEMLDNYLDMTTRNAHPVKEEGWAYALWSSSERDVIHLGAASGELEEVLGRLNSENPEFHPYGVLAAWLVHDPLDAYNAIHEEFTNQALGDGFFRIDLGTARDRTTALLKATDNFALSPWHDYDPEPEQVQQRSVAAAPSL